MDKTIEGIKRAIMLQCLQTVLEIEIEVSFLDRKYRIKGVSTPIVKIGPPVVTLLTPDSTPQRFIIAENAEREFGNAIAKHLETGISFYTELHSGWALPDFLWTRVA